MFESLAVTAFPVVFLAVLFAGGELFRRRRIDMDGVPPINRSLFYGSKYLILVVWAAMVLAGWGVDLSFFQVPTPFKTAGLLTWILGFVLMLAGRLTLGGSFRIGNPRESTSLRVGGLFVFSRNPMYLGVYCTLLASVLRTLNPVLFLLSAFIVVVHHRIVVAEEAYLRNAFGKEYEEYCRRVRRYI